MSEKPDDLPELVDWFRELSEKNFEAYENGAGTLHARGYGDAMEHAADEIEELISDGE